MSANDAQVKVVSYQPQQVDLQVSLSSPGLLVLADTYFPGWTATIDGELTKLLRADFGMRAMQIPAGNHAVRFSFAPLTFRVGLFVTLGTLGGDSASHCEAAIMASTFCTSSYNIKEAIR